MNIVIIGTGNVATVFGRLLAQAGHRILQVFGRNPDAAVALARELQASACSSWEEIAWGADLYLFALSDKAFHELRPLRLASGMVVHTAGSVPIDVLKSFSPNYGVLYPLQSLRKEMPVLTGVPLLVNAGNKETEEKLMELAGSISADARVTSDEARLQYHVAAVFVNNFTNHLYAVAENFCRQQGLDFSLLLPLALETTRRLSLVSPADVVTGPAVRNDQVTIQKHLELLHTYPPMQTLYNQLTDSIQLLQKTKT
ncbi:MAG: DUF2520 domain-containing protein [Williamsia sp.]|nr:DUF2520 domain-containing protein [Williamsia sp.]